MRALQRLFRKESGGDSPKETQMLTSSIDTDGTKNGIVSK